MLPEADLEMKVAEREGFAREIVSKVQTRRKNAGLELTDRIILEYQAREEVAVAMEVFTGHINEKVLVDKFERLEGTGEELEQKQN